ncbi:MAG: ribonuclease P protein component [Actinomycetota bacterium]
MWRVRDPASFRALARGRRRRSGVLEVRTAMLGAPGEPPRVAYAVGKTVGNAVRRNLVRRRLRVVMGGQELAGGRGYLVRVVDPVAVRIDIHTLDLTIREILGGLSHGERES